MKTLTIEQFNELAFENFEFVGVDSGGYDETETQIGKTKTGEAINKRTLVPDCVYSSWSVRNEEVAWQFILKSAVQIDHGYIKVGQKFEISEIFCVNFVIIDEAGEEMKRLHQNEVVAPRLMRYLHLNDPVKKVQAQAQDLSERYTWPHKGYVLFTFTLNCKETQGKQRFRLTMRPGSDIGKIGHSEGLDNRIKLFYQESLGSITCDEFEFESKALEWWEDMLEFNYARARHYAAKEYE